MSSFIDEVREFLEGDYFPIDIDNAECLSVLSAIPPHLLPEPYPERVAELVAAYHCIREHLDIDDSPLPLPLREEITRLIRVRIAEAN